MELFGLADCNNFYCSCERVFHPDLRNKPLVVLSNNDGCVIARSEESKALGIKMGDSIIFSALFLTTPHIAALPNQTRLIC